MKAVSNGVPAMCDRVVYFYLQKDSLVAEVRYFSVAVKEDRKTCLINRNLYNGDDHSIFESAIIEASIVGYRRIFVIDDETPSDEMRQILRDEGFSFEFPVE